MSDATETSSPLRPQPPLAKRLNRNALTVAAIIMGMTVLTAIVVLNPGRENDERSAPAPNEDDTPRVPPRPAFLDQPPSESLSGGVAKQGEDVLPLSLPPSVISSPSYQGAPGSDEPGAVRGANISPVAEESPRERAYRAALASSVLGSGATLTQPDRTGAGDTPPLAAQEEQLITLGDSILRSALRSSAASDPLGPTSPSHTQDAAQSKSSQLSFAQRASRAAPSTTPAELEPAGTPYTLRAGTVIPGALITAINSELPGEIVGQVTRNVYDSRYQRVVLVPKGSRLIGSYETQVSVGQGRLLVAWTRLILPDGRSMRLPGLALADPEGQSGAKGTVDNHWRRVFGNALMLSAISAGVQLSQPSQASILSTPSPGQIAAGAIGQELSTVALEILRRGMDVAPTITVPAGQTFNVLLTGDLVFEGPYEADP
jgi:type IV secretory pathway VirB10-like protein